MTDPAPAPAAQPEPTPPAPAPALVDDTDWKAEARKWEQRAKDNKAAADELATIKDAQKSEAEKAAERVHEAEQKALKAEARALRRDIALEHKLSKDDAALLDTVTDEAAMRSLAARLSKAEADRRKHGNHVPREGNPTKPDGDNPMREFARNLFDRGD